MVRVYETGRAACRAELSQLKSTTVLGNERIAKCQMCYNAFLPRFSGPPASV